MKPPPLLLREGIVGREGRHFPFHDPSPYGAAIPDVFCCTAGWPCASSTSCRPMALRPSGCSIPPTLQGCATAAMLHGAVCFLIVQDG